MKRPPQNLNNTFRRQVYLLTCWQEKDGLAERVFWRFSLETLNTSERRLFKILQEVMDVIETELQRDTFQE